MKPLKFPLTPTLSPRGEGAASVLATLFEGKAGVGGATAHLGTRTRRGEGVVSVLSPIRLAKASLTLLKAASASGYGWERDRVRGSFQSARFVFAPLFVLAAMLLLTITTYADPKFPPLTGRIVDDAHLLKPADKAVIEADLKALEQKSSDQLVIFTTNSLQGYPIEDYGYQLGRAWGIGQKGTNNGVLLIVAPTERKVRIEVGRGLEPQLTDLMTTLIIQNAILPEFRRGDFSAGIRVGVRDIKDVMLGDAEAVKARAAARPRMARKPGAWEELIPLLFIGGIFIFVLWAQSQQARQPLSGGRYGRPGYGRPGYGGPIFFPGGWGGGGGGSGGGGGDGGGFSGGGGDFGGGGASGSW
jgi:uncharacterized protein